MKLVVSSSPYRRVKLTEGRIHLDFIIALIPAILYALYTYGMFGLRVIALAAATALASDILLRKLFKRPPAFTDFSSLLVGILFALILPPTVPYWVVIIGSFLCVSLGKELFGGQGSNPLNPVLVGWAVSWISWPHYFDYNISAVQFNLPFDYHFPLTMLKKGGTAAIEQFNNLDLLLGQQVGGIGAAAILFLFIGGVYLLVRRVVTWEIPAAYILGIIILSVIFRAGDSQLYAGPLFHLLTDNVMIGVFFLSTDYSSAPFSRRGKIAFGLGAGFLTVILRAWSWHVDGVFFAILIMNLFTPLLDQLNPKPKTTPIPVVYMEKS